MPGHEWKHEPYMSGADLVSAMEFGGAEVLIAWPILGSQERDITVKPYETVSLELSFENK